MAHEITLAFQQMAAETRARNIKLGWRNEDGTPSGTFLEHLALLHSEVSEALEAWRSHGLEDATEKPHGFDTVWPKPEGVGSELADVLIRLVDTADAFGIDLAREYHRKSAYNETRPYRHGRKQA